MRCIYAAIQRNHDRLIVMSIRSAELTKYAANAMLAARISFMNELANLAEELGADIEQVRRGIGSDSRIGYHFLYAGCGYGGSCLPKDVTALVRTALEHGIDLQVLGATQRVNRAQKQRLLRKIVECFGPDLHGLRFALWGLAFKANTDDMRHAASIALIDGLLERGAEVQAYDPVAVPEARRRYASEPRVTFASSALEALDGCDALAVVTEWKEFRSPDFDEIKSRLRQPLIFDGRNLYEPALVRIFGLQYHGIGRGDGARRAARVESPHHEHGTRHEHEGRPEDAVRASLR